MTTGSHFITFRDSQIVQLGLDFPEMFQKSSYSIPCQIYFTT